MRITSEKKALRYYIPWYSLHPALPRRGCQAIFIAASGTNFFAVDVRRNADRNMKTLMLVVVGLMLTALNVQLMAQSHLSTPNDVVWHWFVDRQPADTLHLQARFKGKPIYDTSFAISQMRRGDIRPERPHRILKFFFNASFGIFGNEFRNLGSGRVEGNIWEAGRDSSDILLGVDFDGGKHILLNTIHVLKPYNVTRSAMAKGLFVTTRPLHSKQKKGDQAK